MVCAGVIAQKQESPKASTLSDALENKAAVLEQQTKALELKIRTFLRVVVKQSRRLGGGSLVQLSRGRSTVPLYNVTEDNYPSTTEAAVELVGKITKAYSWYRDSALHVIGSIYEEEMFNNIRRCALEIRPVLLENDRVEDKDKKTIPLANQLLESAEQDTSSFNRRALTLEKINGKHVDLLASRFTQDTILCLKSKRYDEVLELANLRRSDLEYEADMSERGLLEADRMRYAFMPQSAPPLSDCISLQPCC